MMTIKKILVLVNILLIITFLFSCSSYDKNSVLVPREVIVKYIGEYVIYSYKYNDDPNRIDQYKEVYLKFVDTDYMADNSKTSNDYYIIQNSKNDLQPLELQIGDRLTFLSYENQNISDYIVGTFLYKQTIMLLGNTDV